MASKLRDMLTLDEFKNHLAIEIDAIPDEIGDAAPALAVAAINMQILHRVDEMLRMMRADFEDRKRVRDYGK
jgi:hypothetical protein